MRRDVDDVPVAQARSWRRIDLQTVSSRLNAFTYKRDLRRATSAFVALGLLLRFARYLADFPLWTDELRLAANLIDPDFSRLGRPLGYAQVCPVGFLAIETVVVRLVGYSTWSLRLVPLISALGSVVLFRHVAGRVLSGLPLLLAVASFSVSWWPIDFAAEVKPYATDLFVARLACLTGRHGSELVAAARAGCLALGVDGGRRRGGASLAAFGVRDRGMRPGAPTFGLA